MGPESLPRHEGNVLAQRADDTVILLKASTGEYYTLNEVGGRIWDLADGTRSVSEIAALIAAEFEAPVEEIEADALELLAELAAESFVRDGTASE